MRGRCRNDRGGEERKSGQLSPECETVSGASYLIL